MKLMDWCYRKFGQRLPDALMGLGTAGVVGGTMMACHATTKLPAIMDEYREQKKQLLEEAGVAPDEEIPKEVKKELRKIKAKTGGKIVLNYTPAAIVEGTSLAGMWQAYGTEKKALIGMSTAYMTIYNGFEKYRENVRKEYGEEVDDKMLHGWEEEEIVSVDEHGEQVVEKVKVYPHDCNDMPSQYARYFCYREADGAEPSFDYNLAFLDAQEKALNRMFKARKKVMLNDVYELLGIKHSVAGNHVGWIYDKDHPSGDNQIKFRIQIVYRRKLDDFGNPDGIEKVLMIDPNVDGEIEKKAVALGLMDK